MRWAFWLPNMAANTKEKLPVADKVFWKNFFYYLLIVVGAILLFSLGYEEIGFNIYRGFDLVSLGVIFILGGKIAIKFSNYERLDVYRKKMNMTPEQFREKYGSVLDILDY